MKLSSEEKVKYHQVQEDPTEKFEDDCCSFQSALLAWKKSAQFFSIKGRFQVNSTSRSWVCRRKEVKKHMSRHRESSGCQVPYKNAGQPGEEIKMYHGEVSKWRKNYRIQSVNLKLRLLLLTTIHNWLNVQTTEKAIARKEKTAANLRHTLLEFAQRMPI